MVASREPQISKRHQVQKKKRLETVNSYFFVQRVNFPECKYIIQKRRKIEAGYLKCIKMNFNKLFQSKQETWVPNINVK